MRRTTSDDIIAGADYILEVNGVHDFTIDKLVDYLEIAKGTFYKYFASKDDILAEVSVKALNQLRNYFKLSERNSPDNQMKTYYLIMSCYYYYIDYPHYFELIVYMERPEFKTSSSSYKNSSFELQKFIIDHVENQQKKGVFKKEINSNLANYFIWGSTMGVMQFIDSKKVFLEEHTDISLKELVEAFVKVLVDGMKV
ncbi:MAG: TetR/AcrR family transcriptional regulator [Flavobacterium sp.]